MTDLSNTAGLGQELISFRIGAQEFCVDIMDVREIRGWTPATAIPQAPAFVRGVINLRGAVLPILDLGARLGLGAADPTARHVIIVTQVEK
uniref:chemotaxis protein CheW n=1 Tax=Phenylobacterium sp. TaxID=1871053 RepID=UPI0028114691